MFFLGQDSVSYLEWILDAGQERLFEFEIMFYLKRDRCQTGKSFFLVQDSIPC